LTLAFNSWLFSGGDVRMIARAHGNSMIEAGITDGDYLFVSEAGEELSVGKVILCRVAGELYAKRLLLEHGKRLLASANRRYNLIRVDPKDEFRMLGVVIGRAGEL
jgi:SOS-response transcriptional repressor LexA